MVRKQKLTRDSYPTYEGRVKQKSKTKWFIILFILMILVIIAGFYIFYQYSTIEETYQSTVYEEEIVPHLAEQQDIADEAPYTVLFVALDNVYYDGAQVEEALWSTLYYVDPEQNSIQAVNIPMNLIVRSNGNEEVNLLTYADGGLTSIKETIESLFEVELNYISAMRLQNIRDIVDPIEPITVNVPVDIEDLSINSNQAVQFSGIEIMKLIDEGNELPTLEQSDLHHAILNSLYTHFFKFENILQLPENFENAAYVIQTEVPFTKLVEIYRNDDYNLTNVDLNELVQLERTQMEDRYIYFADMSEIKEVVSRMASAIDESANKD